MNRFFYKTKGAISVFLILILLPVLLFGGLIVDSSRIYASKVVISDAGEMAMNAALAQYNADLLDEYGLMVMDLNINSDPSSPSYGTISDDELLIFFNKSLNASGLLDEEEYAHLLDLVAQDVNAYAVIGSEIYHTEVERQQIIEYMKYRAPICLTELLLRKLDQMKDVKKQAEALEAQMDFAEAASDCQNSMDEAYKKLKDLKYWNEQFQKNYLQPPTAIQSNLDETNSEYCYVLTVLLLMRQSIEQYGEADNGTIAEMAANFIDGAERFYNTEKNAENRKDLLDSYNDYLQLLYYRNGVSNAGGIDTLLTDYMMANPEPFPAEEDIPEAEREDKTGENTRETKKHVDWREAKEEIEDVITSYKNAEKNLFKYTTSLEKCAKDMLIDDRTSNIKGYYSAAKTNVI